MRNVCIMDKLIKKDSVVAMESTYGQMVTNMMDIGDKTWLMDQVYLILKMDHIMKENGWTTKPMGSECLIQIMDTNIKDNGLKIYKMEAVKRHYKMVQFILELSKMQ